MRSHPATPAPRAARFTILVGIVAVLAWSAVDCRVCRADEGDRLLAASVKAAYLYKFTEYVEWPTSAVAGPADTLVFGVVADDELAESLSRLIRARTPDARPVRLVRLKPSAPLPTIHVLFVGRSEEDHLSTLVHAARGRPILVVSDTEGGLAQGSMINFENDGGHIRFEVGLGSAHRNGITLSSRLLAVAKMVVTEER